MTFTHQIPDERICLNKAIQILKQKGHGDWADILSHARCEIYSKSEYARRWNAYQATVNLYVSQVEFDKILPHVDSEALRFAFDDAMPPDAGFEVMDVYLFLDDSFNEVPLIPAAATITAPLALKRAEYFLSLNEHFVDYINGYREDDRLLYSVPLGKLTPEEAKTIERYAQSFNWAKDCGDATVKKIIIDACAGEVIFTEYEFDRWDIEFDGKLCDDYNLHHDAPPYRLKTILTLVTHTIGEKSVSELSEVLSRFNTDEVEGDLRRKITRDIMKRCIEAATALRENQPLSPPAKPLSVSPQLQAGRKAAIENLKRVIDKNKNTALEAARAWKVVELRDDPKPMESAKTISVPSCIDETPVQHSCMMAESRYDCFISHASEDKEKFVTPLANALKQRGAKVWLDKWEIKWGDSQSGKINDGLKCSRYGIIVCSINFFAKKWTITELDTYVARQQKTGIKHILPIWLNIAEETVHENYPTLAPLRALRHPEQTVDEIADEFMQLLSSDQK